MPNVAYRGRHRPLRSPRLRQAMLGAGLVLPTAATVAAVVAAGSSTGPMALVGLTQSREGVVAALAEAGADEGIPAEPLVRADEERAARDSDRQRIEAVTAEAARRAETEAALAANEQLVEVSKVPATGGSTEGAAGAATPQSAAAASAAGSGDGRAWIKPLNSAYTMTSGFGFRWGSMHPAQDFATPVGTPVLALSSGTVIFAGWQGGYGNKLEIQFWDGTIAWYAHNSSLKVSAGQRVTPGLVIAASGNTGHTTGPHVHLEIHPGGGDPVPPLPWLAKHGISM